jgi:serine/threonine protein kinase
MLKESQAEPVMLNRLSSSGFCQYSKCFSLEKNLFMFRKSYSESHDSTAFHEVYVNERIKHSMKDYCNSNILEYYHSYKSKISATENMNLMFEYSEIGSLFDNMSSNLGKIISSDFYFLRKFLTQVAEALIYIHRLGIIHNDVKFENIMLFKDKIDGYASDSSYKFKLGDFNNSLFVDSEGNIVDLFSRNDNNRCPFDFSFEKPSFKFDYWCLGVMMLKIFYMFNQNSNFYELFLFIRNKSYKGKFRHEIYSRKELKLIENLIEKLLDLDLEERLDDHTIFYHQFFAERRNVHLDVTNTKGKRMIRVYKKKLSKLQKVVSDFEKLKKKNICLNKLKKRMVKYVNLINKIKSWY